MRLLWGIAALTIVWGLCGPYSRADNDAPVRPVFWQKPIEGFGLSEETARRDALRNAKEMLDGLRASLNPLVRTSDLTEDQVEKRFLADAGTVEDIDLLNGGGKKYVVTLKPETVRLLRADERETISVLVIIGLSIILIAGFGYIRLDEYTQRRYTTWLRLAGASVVGTALTGWWIVSRG